MRCCRFLQSIGQSINYDKLVDKINAHIICFRNDNNTERYQELKNLKTYLHYRIAHGDYDTKITAKTLFFEDFRRKHVEAELNKFNRAEKSKQDPLKWRWSPIFQVFQKWPLHNCDSSPWDHTEEEWSHMSMMVLLNINLDAPR